MKKEVLADNIIVYRNAVPNVQELVETLKSCSYWEKWYDVGQQISMPGYDPTFNFSHQPSKEEWDAVVGSWKNSDFFMKHPQALEEFKWNEIEEAFYKTTTDYLSVFPLNDMPNWFRGGANILRYDAKSGDEITTEAAGTLNYALPFHTDFDYPSQYEPGVKPAITVTMYLNDDYEGGDIEYRLFDQPYTEFRIEGDQMIERKTEKIVPGFNYKPRAGDIIIFPSKLPYYHGVKKVTQGQKLFLRTFWMYNI